MNTGFTPVDLAQSDTYYTIWDATPQHSLDYSLPNLWGWQKYFDLEWKFEQDLCWIRQRKPELLWWAPLGNWANINWQEMFSRFPREEKIPFTRVPQQLVNIWETQLPDGMDVMEDRGQWEYLYLQSELATLAGNKFHKKRNHYNNYVKTYGTPDYRPINDTLVTEVLGVQEHWCQWHECADSPSLLAENDAIIRVLAHWQTFRKMCGGSLFIDNKMVAFSIGEAIDTETLGVHFEKGLTGYKGIYQAMNLQFADHAGQGFTWIDRAQDLDEEGLRQAKMTYMPADFLHKFKVTIKS